MTCTIYNINGPPQSGKTTMALGILKELSTKGIDVLFVTTNRKTAEMFQRIHLIPCKIIGAELLDDYIPKSVRAVVIDNLCYSNYKVETIEKIKINLNQHIGPTQLILVNEIEGA